MILFEEGVALVIKYWPLVQRIFQGLESGKTTVSSLEKFLEAEETAWSDAEMKNEFPNGGAP